MSGMGRQATVRIWKIQFKNIANLKAGYRPWADGQDGFLQFHSDQNQEGLFCLFHNDALCCMGENQRLSIPMSAGQSSIVDGILLLMYQYFKNTWWL